YSVIIMTVLCLFVSLAIDYGHMQVIKSQLRRTADAAARYGAMGLTNDAATAVSNAQISLSENTVEGTVPDALIKTGHWDGSTRTFTENALTVNAIQVSVNRTVPLLFARLLNGQNSCAVLASAVCVHNNWM